MNSRGDPKRPGDRHGGEVETVRDTVPGGDVIVDLPSNDVVWVGARVGRYHLVRALGEGGMGVVYEAHDPGLDRMVAIKLLLPRFHNERLVREARGLARLSHPNVVTVHDVGEAAGRTFIAMELIEGQNMREWLAERPRDVHEVLQVMVPAGRGLAAAHAAHLVHRDFKPENVMIGVDGRVRVLDFGLVSPMDAERAGSTAERGAMSVDANGRGGTDSDSAAVGELQHLSSGFVGTPAYMAPEQLSAQAVDERADQFSFCVVLWEALYGERPFNGVTLSERAAGRARARAADPEQCGVPLWLHRILVAGLSGNLAARYPSMDALLQAVEEGVGREAAAARLIGRRYEPLQEARGQRADTPQRALDRLTGKVVTILRMAPVGDGSDALNRARAELAHVFRDSAGLRHPNLVSVLDFGFVDERTPYWVVDLSDAAVSLRVALAEQPEPPIFDHLVQMLRALSYLHRHRVRVGTLTLDDVFLGEHGLKMLPLRMTERGAQGRPFRQPASWPAQGSDVSEDLFAFGQLALSVLAPSTAGSTGRQYQASDLTELELAPALARVLSRVLHPDTDRRYPHADAVIEALADAMGRPLEVETSQTRESRLRAAPLVGREAEVKQLGSAVDAVQRGVGGAWLLCGESGVGKSRLLDEASTLGLAQGALVLRGQEQSEGASPYHLFRDALRWLALLSDLDELEAGVLLPIVPDLATVLDRPVVPAPDLDALAMHARTCDVVINMLRRQKQPMVLLLEDLQWSRSESLELLKQVAPLTAQIPLLIIATVRSDERTGVRQALTAMKPLDLQRLSQDAIGHLLVAMAGESARRPELVDLIWRETEGNAFFVVEVMRALAEEAGGVARIGAATLPDRVLAGGIRRVVAHRLEQVPAAARPLLQVAAVFGRSIDFELLARLSPGVDLEAWCSQCVETSVLERTAEDTRFSHDKLREGVLAELSQEEERELSRRVATALEGMPEDRPDRHSLLAYHFGKAGDVVKEALYAALSGERAIQSFAVAEGRALLVRALELTPETAETAPRRAHLYRLLGEAAYYEGRFNQALSNLTSTLSRLGVAMPASRLESLLLLLKQMLVQVLLFLGILRPKPVDAATARDANEASWAAARAAEVYSYDMDMLRSVTLSLVSVNQVRRGAEENPFGLGVLGYATASLKLGAGVTYFRRARQQTQSDPDRRRSLADVLHLRASFLISVGRLRHAHRVALQSVTAAEEIGDLNAASVGHNIAAICDHLRGKLPRMLSRSRDNQAFSDGEHRLLRATSLALALCELGQPEEALAVLALRPGDTPPQLAVTRATVTGVTALAHARKGSLYAAWEAVQECIRMEISGALVPASCSVILTGPLVAILACWSRAGDSAPAEVAAYERAARWFLRRLRAYGRACQPGTVMLHYFEGHVEALCGERGRALRAWSRASDSAARLGMRHYEGLAQLQLGRANEYATAERDAHLARADALLSACGIEDYEWTGAGADSESPRRADQS